MAAAVPACRHAWNAAASWSAAPPPGTTPSPGKTLAEAEAGLWRELRALQEQPPSEEELNRVRAQVIAGLVYERDSISSQANSIGQLESVGLSWRLIDSDLQALSEVTGADIQAAAQRFFQRERMVVAHILPQENSHE